MPRRIRQGTSGSLRYKNFGKISIADNKIFAENINQNINVSATGTGIVRSDDPVVIQDSVNLSGAGAGIGIGGNVNFGTIKVQSTTGIDNTAFGSSTPAPATFTDFTNAGNSVIGPIVEEVVELSGSTGTVFHDYTSGTKFYHSNPLGDFTVAITNFPTNFTNQQVSLQLFVNQGAIPYIPNQLTINAQSYTLKWNGNRTPSNSTIGQANRFQVFRFDIIANSAGIEAVTAVPITFGTTLDGSTEPLAAPSAQFIKNVDPTATSGVYWINHGNGAYQVYCDMDYGGHILVAKIANTTSTSSPWLYNGSYWGTSTAQDETLCQTTNDGNSATRGYYGYVISNNIRCCLGTKDNALVYATSNTTAKNLFTGSAINLNGTFTRQNWLDWFTAGGSGQSGSIFNNQPFCNRMGFNRSDSASQAMRFGITMNNENDCNSNDSSIGFGTYTNGQTTGPRAIPAGGHRWNPDAQYPSTGYIFCQ